ncbi:Transcriptional activator of maltose regulon, MalT [Olavius algarvensis associated proteobacterium Delta 3]|nr:Transcriptional activator of maltose regulon, MalT [Olavius algarvensis associated proteobacterium Delta 3]
MHLVLIGRRDPPLPISNLRARKFLAEIRTQDLRFSKMEAATLLTIELGTKIESDTAAALHQKTEGWVTGLHLAALSLRHRGGIDPKVLESQASAQYVMEYLFNEVFSQQPPEITQYLLGTAILDRFNGSLCEAVSSPGEDSPAGAIGGWNFIAWLKKENMFVIPLDAEHKWYRFHHLFKTLLHNQLNRRLGTEDINLFHARASAWFAENGMIEEALKHALEGGNIKAAAQLTAIHGFELLDHEQWPRLERWLKGLSTDTVNQDAGLLVLMSWLHMIYDRPSDMVSCLDKAEALASTQTIEDSLQGHLDVLRGFQRYLEVDGERALARARRAGEKIPKSHRWARIYYYMVRALVHQMLGDRAKALLTLELAMLDQDLRVGTASGFFQAHPCFIYWIDADLTNMIRTAAQLLTLGTESRESCLHVHARYFLGIANYQRNELRVAEEHLVEVVKHPHSRHALNFAHGAFALALIHQARGREDDANRVGKAVASYALDAGNSDLFKVARAFETELAVRQGRLDEASQWVEKYQARPFLPTYRFYMPQLTAVKVWLALDTPDHRRHAEDLLNQLHDFLASIHSVRFQIDTLALKALLFDSRKETTVADKALAESLTLAEPGGFIRPFIDLGPRMADLLKRLRRQNVAADYIKRILAAFEEEGESIVVPEAADHAPASPEQPAPGSPATQALMEPLTNRELDVLELLEQRLTNKEIAAELFISPKTVKGHLQNLYGKLNVRKRRDAVEKAKQIGIL